jgi:tetratricopeptide (TPR) repeat protein
MNRWEEIDKVEELFHRALKLEPEERARFIAEVRGYDPVLGDEVESLIAAHERQGSLLDSSAYQASDTILTSQPELRKGRLIDRYEILGSLGRGGMGEVYLAKDLRLDRQVALKLLPQRFTRDEDRLRRFIHEAKTASALNHPNIITIYDILEQEGSHFILMEHVRGQTLRALSGKRMPVELLRQIGSQAARALAVAHSAGIVHRDVKPENIMVRDDGYVKILDFGLASLMVDHTGSSAETLAATEPGKIVGTVSYMSPEQARGETVSEATDVFALGIVFYELAVGIHPFKAATSLGYLHNIVSEEVIPPSRLNPEISSELDSLILQMLRKDSRARPSAGQVDAALALQAPSAISAVSWSVAEQPGSRFVGRETERNKLRSHFKLAADGRGGLFCISGEPGIGKTALVEDFLYGLAISHQSLYIARGRCSERLAGNEAYLPFLEALDDLLHDPGGSVARIMRLVSPNWYAQIASLSPDNPSDARILAGIKVTSQGRLKRELSALLQELSRTRPVLLFLDDLQWADESTTDLLAYLASKLETMRVLVVATYRPSELLLNKHPFLQLRLDLKARGICQELEMGFLSREEIDSYLQAEFPDNSFSSDLSEMIYAKTEGSPLFMINLVSYLRAHQIIAKEASRWIITRPLSEIAGDIPESVRSMIQRKIDQLDEADLRLLVAASVQGQEFDSEVVARTLAMDPAEVEDRLDNMERVHGFAISTNEFEFPDKTLTLRYRFVHSLYQNALYGSLKPSRRAALSVAVATALLGLYGEKISPLATQLALLFATGHDFSRAIDFFLLAARNSLQVFGYREVYALARRGLELIETQADTPERAHKELLLRMTLSVPLIHIQSGASEEFSSNHLRSRELCEQLGETHTLFNIEYGMAWSFLMRGEPLKAREQAETVLRLAEAMKDSGSLMQAHHVSGILSARFAEFLKACAHFEQVIAIYDPKLHSTHAFIYGADPGAHSRSNYARVLWQLGYPEKALKVFEEAVVLATALSHPPSEALVRLDGISLFSTLRDLERMREMVDRLLAISSEHGLSMLAYGIFSQGLITALSGASEEGIAKMREGFDAQQATGMILTLPVMFLAFAEELGKAGHFEEAIASIDNALTMAQLISEHAPEAELYRIKGEILLKQGSMGEQADIAAAEGCFRRALELARRRNAKSYELRSAMSLSRMYKLRGKHNEGRRILAETYGWFTEGFDTADLKEARALLDELRRSE